MINNVLSTTKHIWFNSKLVSTIEDSQSYYQHTDNLGSTGVETNTQGSPTELTTYYSFGQIHKNILNQNNTTKSDQRKYTSHELDQTTNLTYANQRYYNQKIARFISEDIICKTTPKESLIQPQSLNCYSYALNNPYKYTDPSGDVSVEAYSKQLQFNWWKSMEDGVLAAFEGYKQSFFAAIDFTPIGDGVAAYEVVSGEDVRTGQPLSLAERAIAGGSIIPMAGWAGDAARKTSKATRNISKATDLVSEINRHGSYEKHVVGQREYGNMFQSKQQWNDYLVNVLKNPSEQFKGPTKDLYWDDKLGTIIINNKTGGPPTAFRPSQGYRYYEIEVGRQIDQINKGGGK